MLYNVIVYIQNNSPGLPYKSIEGSNKTNIFSNECYGLAVIMAYHILSNLVQFIHTMYIGTCEYIEISSF